jgi:hypothetical protein
MRTALVVLALVLAGCGRVPVGAKPDTSCAGDPTRPISAETLRGTLARHHITVRPHYDGVICGGFIGSPAEEMPVELSNDSDETAMKREGTVFCGLRRGPIWGPKLEKDLDAPASSPIWSGEKAEFSVANVECSIYPDGPRSGAQVRNLDRAMEEIHRLAGR